MSVGAIIIVAIATTGILLMRFRKRWLAKWALSICAIANLNAEP
jgi:hypothetical protein